MEKKKYNYKVKINGKNDTGKPPYFKTVEEMQNAIDAYFSECDNNKVEVAIKSENGAKVVMVTKPRPYTIEGLCEALGFMDRSSLLDYEKDPAFQEYFHTVIRKAKNKITRNKLEGGLMGDFVGNVVMFDLKNNSGYKDKTEIDNNLQLSQTVSETTIFQIKPKA